MVNLKKFVIASATLMALVFAGGTAHAGYSVIHQNIQHNSDGSTTVHTLIENDDTGEQGVHWLQIYEDGSYDSGIVVIDASNPPPDGSPSGVADVDALIAEFMKDGGGYLEQPDFFETPLGKQLVETGKPARSFRTTIRATRWHAMAMAAMAAAPAGSTRTAAASSSKSRRTAAVQAMTTMTVTIPTQALRTRAATTAISSAARIWSIRSRSNVRGPTSRSFNPSPSRPFDAKCSYASHCHNPAPHEPARG